jgi:hypothetical protein
MVYQLRPNCHAEAMRGRIAWDGGLALAWTLGQASTQRLPDVRPGRKEEQAGLGV